MAPGGWVGDKYEVSGGRWWVAGGKLAQVCWQAHKSSANSQKKFFAKDACLNAVLMNREVKMTDKKLLERIDSLGSNMQK